MSSPIPQVVIVGRPNVGKSSIFNWLSQRRIAIEDPTEGVTRDRLTQRIECGDRTIDLIDTGGMGFDDPDGLTEQIDMQIEAGLATAGVIVFVVDIRTGRVPADTQVALRLRQSGATVVLVANKMMKNLMSWAMNLTSLVLDHLLSQVQNKTVIVMNLCKPLLFVCQ